MQKNTTLPGQLAEICGLPMLVLNKTFEIANVNHAYQKYFEVNQQEMTARSLFAVQNGLWNLPVIKTVLHQVLLENKRIRNHTVKLNDPQLSRSYRMQLNAGIITDHQSDQHWIILTLEDKFIHQQAVKPFNLIAQPYYHDDTLLDANKLGARMEKRLDEDLKRTEILENIFSSTHILMAYLDSTYHYVRVNRAYAEAYQRPSLDFLGKSHFDLFHDEEIKQIFDGVVNTGQAYTAFAKAFQPDPTAVKKTTYWDWTIEPMRDRKGEINGVLLIMIDVTARKRTQAELEQTQHQLHQAQRLSDIGRLASMVAHELRNPLGVIGTAVYNIKHKYNEPKIEAHLKRIDKKIAESEQIIDNILNYARIKPPEGGIQSIKLLLDEMMHQFCGNEWLKQITFKLEIAPISEVSIWVDPVQFKEIINNIVINAGQVLKNNQAAMIQINGMLHGEDEIMITIRDNGPGIKDDDPNRLFEPFYSNQPKGTGLGLAICKQLVDLHQGAITIANHPKGGAIVTLILPRHDLSKSS